MNLRSLLPDRDSIATRLAGWFLVIALVPCVFLLWMTLYLSRRSLEASVRQRLMVICDAKASQLEEFMSERRADARSLANAPRVHRGRVPAGPADQGREGGGGGISPRGRRSAAPAGGLRRRPLVRQPPRL